MIHLKFCKYNNSRPYVLGQCLGLIAIAEFQLNLHTYIYVYVHTHFYIIYYIFSFIYSHFINLKIYNLEGSIEKLELELLYDKISIFTRINSYFHSNLMEYDCGDSFPFDIETNGNLFVSKSKEKLLPRSYPIQCERK